MRINSIKYTYQVSKNIIKVKVEMFDPKQEF